MREDWKNDYMVYSKHYCRYHGETNDNLLSDRFLINKFLQIDTN